MAEFLTDGIIWQDCRFILRRLQETSRTAQAVLVKDMAAPVWVAEFLTGRMYKDEAEEYYTVLQDLGGALQTLLVHTADRPRPARIPIGGLGGVTVRNTGGDNDHISLSGLSPSRQLRIGDYLAILTQSGSRELVKVRGNATSNAQSETPLFRITPHLRESVKPGDPVQLDRPRMEARIEPGSLAMSRSGMMYEISFTALQVIR